MPFQQLSGFFNWNIKTKHLDLLYFFCWFGAFFKIDHKEINTLMKNIHNIYVCLKIVRYKWFHMLVTMPLLFFINMSIWIYSLFRTRDCLRCCCFLEKSTWDIYTLSIWYCKLFMTKFKNIPCTTWDLVLVRLFSVLLFLVYFLTNWKWCKHFLLLSGTIWYARPSIYSWKY